MVGRRLARDTELKFLTVSLGWREIFSNYVITGAGLELAGMGLHTERLQLPVVDVEGDSPGDGVKVPEHRL